MPQSLSLFFSSLCFSLPLLRGSSMVNGNVALRSLWLVTALAATSACGSSNGVPPVIENNSTAISLECSLKAPPPGGRAGDPVKVGFRLKNLASSPVFVLTWRSPLEGLFGDDWSVTRDGVEIPYQGPMMKRGDPAADDYVSIAPGAAAEAEVEVSLAYVMREPGRYHIALRGPLMDATTVQAEVPRPLAQHRAVPLTCAPIDVELKAP